MDYEELAAEILRVVHAPKKTDFQQIFDNEEFPSDKIALLLIKDREKGGGCSPKEIGDALCVSAARTTVVLNELEGKGLIAREIDKSDRRQIVVRMTPEGGRVAEEQRRRFIKIISAFLSRLGERDAAEYVRITIRLHEIARDFEPPR